MMMRFCAIVLILGCVTAMANGMSPDSAAWEGKFECDTLPTGDGWVQKMGGADAYATAQNGILRVNSIDSNQFPHWLKSVPLDLANGVTVEWRLKMVQTDPGDVPTAAVFGVHTSLGTAKYDVIGFGFGESAIIGEAGRKVFDAADGYHTYRLVVNSAGYRLHIDNAQEPIFTGPLKVAAAANAETGIEFGDQSSQPDAEYLIDYIRWTQTGAYPPPVGNAGEQVDRPAVLTADTLNNAMEDGALIFSLPAAKGRPKLNGRIDEGEYTFSASGFMDVYSGEYAARQSVAYFTQDNRALYVAIESPQIGELRAKGTKHDAREVISDDAVELHIIEPVSNQHFQFIINSRGAIFDQRNTDLSWNLKDTKFLNRVEDGRWVLEGMIPFSDLGVPAPADGTVWRVNICRSYAGDRPLYTSLSPCRHSYLSPRQFAYMQFSKDKPVVAMRSSGDLMQRDLQFNIALEDPSSADPINVEVTTVTKDETKVIHQQQHRSGEQVDIAVNNEMLPAHARAQVRVLTSDRQVLYAATFVPHSVDADTFEWNFLYADLRAHRLNLGVHVPERYLAGGDVLEGIAQLSNGDQVVHEKKFQIAAPDSDVWFDLMAISPGDFDVEIIIKDGSEQAVANLADTFTKFPDGPASWEGNQIGISTEVPAPWIPMARDGETLSLWGRAYSFDRSVFPQQLTTQGKELLARPMQLSMSLDGEKTIVQSAKSEWVVEQGDAYVRQTQATEKGVDIQVETRVEFDGFTWITLKLNSHGPVRIDEMRVQIPFAKDSARLANFARYRMEGTGALPEGLTAVDLREELIFWIGSEFGGIQWYAESLKGWSCADWAHSLEVVNDPAASEVVAQLNVVDAPITIDGEHEISFGFQVTPVKPRRADARGWRFRPWESTQPYNIECWFTEWSELLNYPELSQLIPEKIAAIKEMRAQNIKVIPYMALGMTTPYSPEFKYYGEEWRAAPFKRIVKTSPLDPQWKIWANRIICNSNASYRDFYVQKVDTALKELRVDGLYFDFGTSQICQNPLHGCGWTDNTGKLNYNANIRGSRELAKRLYNVINERAPGAIIIHHMSGEIDMATNAYCDAMFGGENLTGGVMVNESYFNVLPLDKFRAELLSKVWGPVSVIIPQFKRAMNFASPGNEGFYDTPAGVRLIDHLIGLTLVHDTMIWPIWGVKPDQLWAVQDAFGWDEKTEFLPYWDNSEYVKIVSEHAADVVVSAYRHGSKAMLVPFNNTDEPVSIVLEVNVEKFGIEGTITEARDEYFGETMAVQGGQMTVSLPARSFRMIVMGK